jgi:sulfite reductase (NADPH) flavoprotein alpha-component
MSVPVLPESAPFTLEQRAWLNGFFAGLSSGDGTVSVSPAAAAPAAALPEEETFPWHDPAMPLEERLKLADGNTPARQLMAAMAQLDCGSCGYVCQTYGEAIASGADKDLTKCSPGGKETSRKLKELYVHLNINAAAKPDVAVLTKSASAGVATREMPAAVPLLANRRLNSPQSQKEVRHIEFNLKGADLTYNVGDAVGIWPENCLDTVSQILDRLRASGAEECHTIDGRDTTLFEALHRERVITQPTESLIELLVETAGDREEAKLLQSWLLAEQGEPLSNIDVLDVLLAAPSAQPRAADFVGSLAKLQPRLYSISSSPQAHVNQVHLTVGAVRFRGRSGRTLRGVASTYLADRVRPGERVRMFIHPSKHFGLPRDGSASIIMIGPGTGIAPFRAFLHDRRATGAKGRNWLFFGDQRQSHDFLYRDELETLLTDGSLHRLDTAFSRDQLEKVYVQHRMAERGAELWKWLNDGAHLYVCGDARRMAKDVDDALRRIVAEHGGMSDDNAKAYLSDLSRQNRYQRDIY